MLKKNNKLQMAMLFEECKEDGDNLIIKPVSVLLGETFESTKTCFHDYLSDAIYMDGDIAFFDDVGVGFALLDDVSSYQKVYKQRDLLKLSREFLKEAKKYAYYYKGDKPQLCVCTLDSYEDQFGTKVEYSNPEITKDIVKKTILRDASEVSAMIEEMENPMMDEDFPTPMLSNGKSKVESTVETIKKRPIGDLCSKVKESVICQDDAIKKVATAIYKNYYFGGENKKSNILLYGPTGVGKTEIIRSLAKTLGVPVLVEDLTRYTPAGYVGGDLENMLNKLIRNANGDVKLAQKSILVLDELDKKAADGSSSSKFKEDVLTSLLKIIEGSVVDVSSGYNTVNFDTSQLTVIACGAFSDLYKSKEKKNIGFGTTEETKKEESFGTEDFIKYGLPPEFIGRFSTIVRVNSLSEKDLERILKESNISPLKRYEESFKKMGVELNLDESVYEAIASKAARERTGARALEKVVDDLFEDTLYDVFDAPNEEVALDLSDSKGTDKQKFTLRRKAKAPTAQESEAH